MSFAKSASYFNRVICNGSFSSSWCVQSLCVRTDFFKGLIVPLRCVEDFIQQELKPLHQYYAAREFQTLIRKQTTRNFFNFLIIFAKLCDSLRIVGDLLPNNIFFQKILGGSLAIRLVRLLSCICRVFFS